MNCSQAREYASDYIDGEVSYDIGAALEEHLTTCTSCPALMAALIGVLAELRGLPAIEPTRTWVQATVARANNERKSL